MKFSYHLPDQCPNCMKSDVFDGEVYDDVIISLIYCSNCGMTCIVNTSYLMKFEIRPKKKVMFKSFKLKKEGK